MIIAAVKETAAGERRAALTPSVVERLVRLGAEVQVQAGLGAPLAIADARYEEAGATVVADEAALLRAADLVAMVAPPDPARLRPIEPGTAIVGFLDPFREPKLVEALMKQQLAALCMELIPRSTYAQKMDALSSQASLAGYAAVLEAAAHSPKALPMMTTPAGTIAPARVFVIGVGVAGLQAIATAKRLGARVEAYDTRPVVAEQVQSLGAKFVVLDVGETGQTDQGYAKELTEEQLEMQRKQMAAVCARSDIVITTAQLFGRPAPRIVSDAMVAGMKPGSVIVDLAAGTGGNVEGSEPDRVVEKHGVTIVGHTNLPSHVALDASQMYANNVFNLIQHAWNAEEERMVLDPDDDVIGSALLVQGGRVRDERVRSALGLEDAATAEPGGAA